MRIANISDMYKMLICLAFVTMDILYVIIRINIRNSFTLLSIVILNVISICIMQAIRSITKRKINFLIIIEISLWHWYTWFRYLTNVRNRIVGQVIQLLVNLCRKTAVSGTHRFLDLLYYLFIVPRVNIFYYNFVVFSSIVQKIKNAIFLFMLFPNIEILVNSHFISTIMKPEYKCC